MTTTEQNSRSIYVAEAAQDLLNLDSQFEVSWPRVQELHGVLERMALVSIQRPEERAVRVARGCRNAPLTGLVHMGAMQTLQRVYDGSLVEAASKTPDQEVQDIVAVNWPGAESSKLSAEECRLLATLWKETNDDFEAVAQWRPLPRPDLTGIWRIYDRQVGQTTTALLDFLDQLLPEQLTRNDQRLLKWLAGGRPHETRAYKRARVTNRSTVTMVFNLMLGRQLDSNSQLTGPELDDTVLEHIDPAAAVSGGRREFVTSVIGPCPHVSGSPTTTDETGRYSKLTPFSKRTHAHIPGDCVAYPLLTPGASDQQRKDKLELIKWHRQTTNKGLTAPDYPEGYIRSSEVTIRAGAAIAKVLWPDSRPFRSV